MNKKIRFKRALIVLLICTCIQFAGCDLVDNIKKENNLKDNEAMAVSESVCSADVARLFVMDLANKYKKDFDGNDLKNIKIGDMAFDNYIKTKAENDLSIVYALSALAKKENINVSKEEESAIDAAVQTYVGELSNKEISFANVTSESVKELYTNYYLADKYCNKKIENISEEVSDEDARVIHIQYIHINTETDEKEAKKTLEKVKKQVEGGYQDFLVEASRYTNDDVMECKLCKNKAQKEFEKTAFELQDGQVSDVITDDDGLYLVRCLEAYMESETDRNKADIIAMNKASVISKGYNEFIKDVDKQINEDVWKDIKVITPSDVTASNLFEIYTTIEE